MIHHRVDGVLQLKHLALHIDGDLLGQVSVGHGRRDHRDVAHLRGEVGGHEVHRFGEILPRAGRTRHHRLPAETAIRADLAHHAGHLRGERTQLVDHRVGGLLQLQNLSTHVDRDFLGQVAVGHADGHLGDVAHLRCQIAGHLVDRVGEFLPHPRHALDPGLAAELALGAHLAGDARHLGREDRELLDHRVHQLGRAQKFSLERASVHLEVHRLSEVALGDGTDGASNLGRGPHQIVHQRIDAVDLRRPVTDRPRHRHALLQPSFFAHGRAQAGDLVCDPLLACNGLIERRRDLPIDIRPIGGQATRKIAVPKCHHSRQDLARTGLGRLDISKPTTLDSGSRSVGGSGRGLFRGAGNG